MYPESGMKQFFYDSAPSTPGVACSTLSLPTNASPLGNLVKTYDANGTTTCYSYDSLNRVIGIAYSGANFDGANKYFVYDSANVNGVAMLNAGGDVAEAYTAATVTGTKLTDQGFSYTVRGEVSDVYESTPKSLGYYHTTATYFANGAVNTLSGVNGGPWTYAVDGKGRPYSAMAGTSTNLVSSTTYNAADEPLVITLGLGDTDTYVYDGGGPLTTGRMTSYTFSVGATPTTHVGSLNWNANGTLRSLSITDGFNSGGTQTCNYGTSSTPGYDELGRLVSAVCTNSGTNVWGQSFSYDAFDNLTKSVPTGDTGVSWQPGYNQANNHYTLGGTSYDSNGNLLKDTFHTYTWNQDNHVLTVTGGTSGPVVYDAFGRMAEKLYGSTYTEPLYTPVGDLGLMTQSSIYGLRVPLPGGATYAGVSFWHRDWLGSVRLVSTRTGRAETVDRAFAPYGETYNGYGLSADQNFTGDNQDLVSGTFDTPNRQLNPTQGRWIQPDPTGQTWNGYAYVTAPLGEVDPLGLGPQNPRWQIFDAIGSQSSCGGDPNCATYYVNGFEVSAIIAQSILGTGGGGSNSFTNSSFFFNASAALSASSWTLDGGNLYGVIGVHGDPYWTSPDDVWHFPVTALLVNLGSVSSFTPDNADSAAANNGGWGWNFTKSFFKGFSLSTKPGTCLGVFADTVTAPIKQVQSAVKNYVPLIVGAMQAGPSGAAMYMQQLNAMVQAGAAEADPQVAAVVTTAGAAAGTMAPYVSAAVPYAAGGVVDATLAVGVVNEVNAGLNGQCIW